MFAVALAAAGYALLLAVRQTPVDAGERPSLGSIPTLPEPARLPRRPSFVPASLPAATREFPAPTRSLRATVLDLPARHAAAACIGAVDATGALCAVRALSEGTATAGGVQIDLAVPADGELRVVVAGAVATARRGYWCSAPVAPQAAAVELRVPVQDVLVHVGALTRQYAAALRLRRSGDAEWAPVDVGRSSLGVDRKGDLALVLGPGQYELAPWLGGPWQPVVLTVPGPTEVTATFAP